MYLVIVMPIIDYTKNNYCKGCEIKYPKENSYCTDRNGCGRLIRTTTKLSKYKKDKPRH